jgi:hypothetical protein
MNDPHVAALLYQVEHSPTFDYEKAQPCECDLPEFHIRIESNQATVEPKDHFACAGEARAIVEPFLRVWELDAALTRDDPGVLRFVYLRQKIVDRSPTPGVVVMHAQPLSLTLSLGTVVPRLGLREYPPPPAGLSVSTDVDAMYDRFTRYKAGQIPLGPIADFCLTVLEKGGQRSTAGKKYDIDIKVLSRLGTLAAEKGGRAHSRKWKGWSSEYTEQERAWVETTVRAIIRRAAEVAHDPDASRALITMNDLPPL